MKCPKCGGEIPFYDLKPKCSHCGVNILYYTQNEGLMRDAKRTELEGAAARMIIARVKANFIGSKIVIVRLVMTLLMVAALLVPFGSVHFHAAFFDNTVSAGLIGVIRLFTDGLFTHLFSFAGSALFGTHAAALFLPLCLLIVVAVFDIIIAVTLLLGFLDLTGSINILKKTSLIGAIVAAAGQIAVIAMSFIVKDTEFASYKFGFGALVCAAMLLVSFFINRIILKKGIEPVYKENDIKRRDMLKRVRAGEVSLDSLPLPVFESEDEREERLKALEEALLAEEEGKEL